MTMISASSVVQVPPGSSLLAHGRNWPLVITALWLILGVAALLSIWLGRHHSRRAKVVWTVVVIALPIVGAIAWFTLGWERRR